MARRIPVIISQGQSHNPRKRGLEEDLVAALLMEPSVDVMVIPNLYDLQPDGTGVLALEGIGGDMVIVSWLYPRAAHWTLDRLQVRGRVGPTLLVGEDEEEDEETEAAAEDDDKQRVADHLELPSRQIYCLDFRASEQVEDYVAEIRRIADEQSRQVVQLGDWAPAAPTAAQQARFANPTNSTALAADGGLESPTTPAAPTVIDDAAQRRWYPVIDFSRCTNCMECIDFCLFGVYGVDAAETILVEQPDNCRKGCPACSRVCPENAIIFPQHKSPAIAGSATENAGLKIDLSQLFGGGDDPVEVAARERDEQLLLAGREAVGLSVGIPKRQADKPDAAPDELDELLDELDELNL